MVRYKECLEYYDELREYVAGAYLTCPNEVTQMMIEKGLDVAIPILIEMRKSLGPSKPIY